MRIATPATTAVTGAALGVPVALVSVGPGRDQVLWTQASVGMAGALTAPAGAQ